MIKTLISLIRQFVGFFFCHYFIRKRANNFEISIIHSIKMITIHICEEINDETSIDFG